MRLCFFLCVLAWPVWAEPQAVPVGDPLRRALLEAIRPDAEALLGAPVLFRVLDMRVEGDRAFAQLYGERPGGVPIDLETTPAVVEMGWSLDLFDGPRLEVFYHQTGGEWRVVQWEVGATDVWWWGYDCPNYAAFFPEGPC